MSKCDSSSSERAVGGRHTPGSCSSGIICLIYVRLPRIVVTEALAPRTAATSVRDWANLAVLYEDKERARARWPRTGGTGSCLGASAAIWLEKVMRKE